MRALTTTRFPWAPVASVMALVVLVAMDWAGALDATRVGSGAGPIGLAWDPRAGLLATANWDAGSAGLLSLGGREGETPPAREVPVGCRPFLVEAAGTPGEFFISCMYEETLGLLDARGAVPVLRRLGAEGCDVPRLGVGDCFVVAVVPLSPGEALVVRAILGDVTLAWFASWRVERVRVDEDRLVPLARSRTIKSEHKSIGRWCARLDETTGDLWVSDPPGDRVVRFAPTLAVTGEAPVAGFPRAMALDSKGRRLFVASESSGEVSVLPLDGEPVVERRRRIGEGPTDLEWDGDRGLVVLLRGERELVRLDPDTLVPTARTHLAFRPWDFEMVDGSAWVVGEGSGKPVELR